MGLDLKVKVSEALELHQKGQFEDAESAYKKILQTDSENTDTLNLLGLLKLQLSEFDEAISYIKKAVELNPNAYFLGNLGRAYAGREDFVNARECYKKAMELEGESFDLLFNLALCEKSLENFDTAIELYKKAIEINPNSAEAYLNLANTYESKNDTKNALEYYKKAKEYNISGSEINYFLSATYLKTKDFKNGWEYYEDRPSKIPGALTQIYRYKKALENKPLWQGEDLTGKNIFLYYEAGLGDSFMFARYFPQIVSMAKKVYFKPQHSIVSFFKENNFGMQIVDMHTKDEELEVDYHLPIMSLPYILGHNSEEDIPNRGKIFEADFNLVEKYRQEFFNNDKFKIGIKWQGNTAYDLNRIIPFEGFFKLFELENTQFYSLQKDDGAEALATLPSEVSLIDLGPTFCDFAATAAAIENLDLVICNDTSVAHLAAAMGKPCWMMVPFVSNWRWFLDTSYTPWYDSMKLYKQTRIDSWEDVFDCIYKDLKEIIK